MNMNLSLCCNICGKNILDESFLKNQANIPKYFVDAQFYMLTETTIFCSPDCSTKWYLANYYQKTDVNEKK